MYTSTNPQKHQARVAALQAEIEDLQKELGKEEDADEIVSKHHKLLHKYNESKDAAQILMGRLAEQRQVTIRQLYAEYELTDRD
ncbi:DNA repair protein [Abortiporus biennis]|nr:DNA repair protein [Abortiporus biennis]